MSDDDTQGPVNGWVPPAVRGNRLPPYAPRPAATPTTPAATPAETVTPEVAVPGPGVLSEAPTTVVPVVPAAPERAYAAAAAAPDLFGTEPDPPTELIPLVTAPAPEPELVTAGRRTPPPRRRDPIRTAARGIGQTLITLGVVVLLFVVYEVYVTDIFGAQKQAAATEKLEIKWEEAHQSTAADPGTVIVTAPPSAPAEPPPPASQERDPASREITYDLTLGDAFAKIYIPTFGADYAYSIVEGTHPDDLYVGPGHYDDTQLPGELGNFAVAGHRVSKGSPFNELGSLASCDAMVVETQDDWFVYRVLPMDTEIAGWDPAARPDCAGVEVLGGDYSGVLGREITLPSDYAQVHPIPHQLSAGPDALAAATERLITLTTCHPQFSDAERMIVHGVLVKSYAKADGFTPPELLEG